MPQKGPFSGVIKIPLFGVFLTPFSTPPEDLYPTVWGYPFQGVSQTPKKGVFGEMGPKQGYTLAQGTPGDPQMGLKWLK